MPEIQAHIDKQAQQLDSAMSKGDLAKAGTLLLDAFDKDPRAALSLIQREQMKESTGRGGATYLDLNPSGDLVIHNGDNAVYAGHPQRIGNCQPEDYKPADESASWPRQVQSIQTDNAIQPPDTSADRAKGDPSVWNQFEGDVLTSTKSVAPDESASWTRQVQQSMQTDNAILPADTSGRGAKADASVWNQFEGDVLTSTKSVAPDESASWPRQVPSFKNGNAITPGQAIER